MLAEIAPQLEWLLIQIEFVIAIWLLIGWAEQISWWFALLLFSSFTGASLMMVVQGRSTCGCLGVVEFNPLWMLLFDGVVIGLLLCAGRKIFRVSKADVEAIAPYARPTFGVRALGLILLAALMGGVGVSQSAVIGAAIAEHIPLEISGQYLVASPSVYDVGTGQSGQWHTLKIKIRNRSDTPVTLIGAEQGCRCRAIGSLPLDVPPAGEVEISVDVRLGQSAGVQHDRFWILTNHQRQGMLICRWRADVIVEKSSVVSVVPIRVKDNRTARLRAQVGKSDSLFEGVF